MTIQRDLILKSFLLESEEGFSQMEQAILKLESCPEDSELIQIIFRVVHTAKGNASILEIESLLAFSHALEDLLDTIRQGELLVTSAIITLLLSSLDVMRQMVTAAADGIDETSQRAREIMVSISRYRNEPDDGKDLNAIETIGSFLNAEPAPPAAGTAQKQAARTLRVDLEKLDRLLNLAGEITIARGRMAQMLESGDAALLDEIREIHSFADTLHLELQETILKMRMVPVGPLFRQYTRTVRDLAQSHGKLAQLHIVGEDVEVDTSIVEQLRDPLLHMIRNAVDHGLEAPAERKKLGKSPVGTITLRAAHEGGNIVVEVCDDGAGINRQKIIETAQKRDIFREFEKLSDEDIFQLVFESGFSTSQEVTDLSGRGVGMDVVRRNVQALRGTVHITSQFGKGSNVHIRLPLTLAIIEGFGVGVGGETYVIPVDQVLECVELPPGDCDQTRKEGILQLRNEPLPFLYLRDHFGLSGHRPARQNIVVVQDDEKRAGLAVDELYGATQTVIKPLPAIFKAVPGVSGTAILGNGKVALILDTSALLRNFQTEMTTTV